MSELRWHPLLQEWVITATHRQERTFFPPDDYCPLCPTKQGGFPTEVPLDDYKIVVFENKFPSLRSNSEPAVTSTDYSPVRPADGVCEVICYTPDHQATLSDLSVEHIERLVEVWTDRFQELSARPEVEYVFIFENKGKEIGVTLNHPHGQIYAYPFIPPKVAIELAGSLKWFKEHGECLMCHIVESEIAEGTRIVETNDTWVSFVPFFARYPYEVYVTPRTHCGSLSDFSPQEKKDFARILKSIAQKYDRLFGFSLPYMMVMHQTPSDGGKYGHYHFHVEFYPPHRDANKLKYLAGSEAGAGAFINDILPEETAERLRKL